MLLFYQMQQNHVKEKMQTHAIAMTFGGTLVGLAHIANLRLNHGHIHDSRCAH